jgi:hypothetical protein
VGVWVGRMTQPTEPTMAKEDAMQDDPIVTVLAAAMSRTCMGVCETSHHIDQAARVLAELQSEGFCIVAGRAP